MRTIFLIFTSIILFSACQHEPKKWALKESIDLGNIAPIGLTQFNGSIWVSDGDNNKLIELNEDGSIKTSYEGFDRPMHIDSDEDFIYVPEYGSDTIRQFNYGKQSTLTVKDSLNAPAGVASFNKEIAIADFYNHQVHYFNGGEWLSIGRKGNAVGQFHYPTDVQITADRIYVADAYNHRIQVFDKNGTALSVIGEADKMNATTGIYISKDQIFATDFENNRVLVYDTNGSLLQEINDLNKPVDLLVVNDKLHIINYKGKTMLVYE